MIRTLDYGMLPIAKDTTYINAECVGTVETCDGKFYEVCDLLQGWPSDGRRAMLPNTWRRRIEIRNPTAPSLPQ